MHWPKCCSSGLSCDALLILRWYKCMHMHFCKRICKYDYKSTINKWGGNKLRDEDNCCCVDCFHHAGNRFSFWDFCLGSAYHLSLSRLVSIRGLDFENTTFWFFLMRAFLQSYIESLFIYGIHVFQCFPITWRQHFRGIVCEHKNEVSGCECHKLYSDSVGLFKEANDLLQEVKNREGNINVAYERIMVHFAHLFYESEWRGREGREGKRLWEITFFFESAKVLLLSYSFSAIHLHQKNAIMVATEIIKRHTMHRRLFLSERLKWNRH